MYYFDLCPSITKIQTFKMKVMHLISTSQPSWQLDSHNLLSKATISSELIEVSDEFI